MRGRAVLEGLGHHFLFGRVRPLGRARSPLATCDSSYGGAWSAYVGRLASILLRGVTTSAGAAVTYEKASVFGAAPRDGLQYVATKIEISGPRGFSTTWVYDGAAGLVRTTTWATGSHVFKGSPTAVEWGTPLGAIGSYAPAQPPAATPFRRAAFSYAARGQNASCTAAAAEPAAAAYPATPVVTSAVTPPPGWTR